MPKRSTTTRRPQKNARDSHAAILQAAALEFAEHGFDAARVDRIAARARLNKAMIYYHFGSKDALYVEVLQGVFGPVGSRARAIADNSGAAEEKIDRWIAAIVEEAAARPWLPSILLREFASGAAHLNPDSVDLMNTVFSAVRDMILQGQREGAFRDVDPLLAHMTIMPAVLLFFARQRIVSSGKFRTADLIAPRQLDDFVRHMQASARGMLRKTT
jgi:AcrR family transcriptional regulator